MYRTTLQPAELQARPKSGILSKRYEFVELDTDYEIALPMLYQFIQPPNDNLSFKPYYQCSREKNTARGKELESRPVTSYMSSLLESSHILRGEVYLLVGHLSLLSGGSVL